MKIFKILFLWIFRFDRISRVFHLFLVFYFGLQIEHFWKILGTFLFKPSDHTAGVSNSNIFKGRIVKNIILKIRIE